MPDLLSEKDIAFSRRLKARQPGTDSRMVAEENEVKYIGAGSECAVIALNNGEGKNVVAFRYQEISPQSAKETYYLARILSTLFPHNFPRFQSSFAGNNDRGILPGTIRTKINSDFPHQQINNELYIKRIKYRFEDAEKIIKNKLKIPVKLDTFPTNLNIGLNGGEYFLDTPKIGSNEGWEKTKIIDYMTTNKRQDGVEYTPYDMRVVSQSLNRLAELKSINLT